MINLLLRAKWYLVFGLGLLTFHQIADADDTDPRHRRRIPVNRIATRPQGATQAVDGPIAEQPGEVTEVIIRNEAGEIVDGELSDGEFFIGPRPTPVIVGQPVDRALVEPVPIHPMDHSSGLPLAVPEGDQPISVLEPSPSADCMHCDQAGCDGLCRTRPLPPHAQLQQARIETIAAILANPFADFWVRADYVRLFVDGQRVPPLVTTGPTTAAREDAGVIGQPGTAVLYSGALDDDARDAMRFELGRYLGTSGLAVSGSILFSEELQSTFRSDQSSFDLLARPFIDAAPTSIGNNAELIVFPGTFTGSIQVDSSTTFGTADALVHAILVSDPGRQISTFLGYQFASLDDGLTISDSRRVIGGTTGLTVGTELSETDHFSTRNRFHGLAMGLRGDHCVAGWSLRSAFKLSLGVNDGEITRRGSAMTVVPLIGGGTDVATRDSGLLVQDTNSGVFQDERFAVVPEIQLRASRRLPSGWDASIGYQFLYWSQLLRAGSQIDPLVNLTQVSTAGLQGLARPEPLIVADDLLVHGITFGLSHEF
ncbi:MAG: BBP7 family outer membrane beta-barrel protein [Planctomycetota bacterium]